MRFVHGEPLVAGADMIAVSRDRASVRIGLISDTHNLLRPQALSFLEGSDLIVHAGDICNSSVLEALADIAPLTAVRGNNDRGEWAERLRENETLQVGQVRVHVIHDLAQLAPDPGAAGIRVVVSGHSHKPLVEERDGVLYVNPGSAGRRRFRLPVAVGELLVDGSAVTARIVHIKTEVGAAPAARPARRRRVG